MPDPPLPPAPVVREEKPTPLVLPTLDDTARAVGLAMLAAEIERLRQEIERRKLLLSPRRL